MYKTCINWFLFTRSLTSEMLWYASTTYWQVGYCDMLVPTYWQVGCCAILDFTHSLTSGMLWYASIHSLTSGMLWHVRLWSVQSARTGHQWAFAAEFQLCRRGWTPGCEAARFQDESGTQTIVQASLLVLVQHVGQLNKDSKKNCHSDSLPFPLQLPNLKWQIFS